ncbi:hypothetical protein GCM10017624_15330 [Azotobacter vinelandii]|nr:hypothetical protein GCM10017624_15330 [Azotobacter vinelandii]
MEAFMFVLPRMVTDRNGCEKPRPFGGLGGSGAGFRRGDEWPGAEWPEPDYPYRTRNTGAILLVRAPGYKARIIIA